MEIVKWIFNFLSVFLMGGFVFGIFSIKDKADNNSVNFTFCTIWFITMFIINIISAILTLIDMF